MSPPTHDELQISDTLSELRRQGYQGSSTFWSLHKLVLDGRIPSRRSGRSRLIARSDLPEIATALGLKAPDSIAA